MIRTENLSKSFGQTRALHAVNLAVDHGVLGLLGPNGAGKTTLMRILATLLAPSEGRASVLGHDVVKDRLAIRRTLGYLPQDYGAYPKLSGRDYLRYIGYLKELRNPRRLADEALASMGLADVARRRVSTYSGGMLRRLGIAQALLGDPRVLLIDEPTSGLDPEQRASFREFLLQLAGTRVSILSTHLVEDVALVCRDLAVIRQGELAFRGTPDALQDKYAEMVTEVVVEESAVSEFLALHRDDILSTSRHSDRERAVRLLRTPDNGRLVRPSLEDAYLALIRS
jgi:ABC-type multidrug transport system ATPase subunit